MTLKKIIIAGAAALTSTSLFANDAFIEDCEAFKSANGVDGDCSCLAEKSEAAGVLDEIMGTQTLEDLGNLSEEAKAVIEECS